MSRRTETVKLTKRAVDALKPAAKERILWDEELVGYGLRISPTGVKTYFIQYRDLPGRAGRTRRLKLGRHGELTPDQARRLAEDRLGQVRHGANPSAERKKALKAPSVAELAHRYMEQHAKPKKKPLSVRNDEQLLRLHILPALGRERVADLSREQVSAFHHSLRDIPIQANRALALLSKMMNLAEGWDLRPGGSNPCRHVEKFKERHRERFLSGEELGRLGDVLAHAEAAEQEEPVAILAIRLLLFTGARKGEILALRWEEVDFERPCLRLADSKTGEKVVPLSAPALKLLAGSPRLEDNPYVCYGARKGTHFQGLHRPWARLRKKAGLEGVRLHDLRHTFASYGASSGLGLPIIGGLLGHKQAATTQRYAHLAADPLLEAADRIAGEIQADLDGREGQVVAMPAGRRA